MGKPGRQLCAALVAFVGMFALLATPALAGTSHKYETQIVGPSLAEPFAQPWGLAVDSANNLYVADAQAQQVDVFGAANVFAPPPLDDASVGADPFTGPYVRSVAIDNLAGSNKGDVYVAESNLEFVDLFKPEGGGKYKLVQERKFGGYMYVAFDNSGGARQGDVYVLAESRVFVIKPNAAGELEEAGTELQVSGLGSNDGLAVSPVTGDLYVAQPGSNSVAVFNDKGEPEGAVAPRGAEAPGGFGTPSSVAVDPTTGEVYVTDEAHQVVDEFSPGGEYLGHIRGTAPGSPFTSLRGVAVNSSGHVYVSDGTTVDEFGPDEVSTGPQAPITAAASGTTPTSTVLHGTLEAPESEYYFAYSSGTKCSTGSQTPVKDGVGKVSEEITSLEPHTTYKVCLIAENISGRTVGNEVTVTTPALPPVIEEANVTDISATSAILHAKLVPNGPVTTYTFEYAQVDGAFTAVPQPEGKGTTAEGGNEAIVSVHMQELAPDTAYQFRLVAINSVSTVTSKPVFFTTQAPNTFALLDDRGWELVSPPNKDGADLNYTYETQAAPNGEAISYLASGPTEGQPPADGPSTKVLSTRTGSGWQSHDIDPPNPSGTGLHQVYHGLSEDLSRGVVEPVGRFSPLSPEASERTPYLTTNFSPGDSASLCREGCYRPLVTGAPGFADVPSGVAFGEESRCAAPEEPVGCGPAWLGASPDFSHLILASNIALTPGAPESSSYPRAENGSLYEWYEGHLNLLSVLPDGEPATPDHQQLKELRLGQKTGGFHFRTARAVSTDGSRVVWSEGVPAGSNRHLYLRYNATQPQSAVNGSKECDEAADACTLQLDQVKGGSGEGFAQAGFQTASVDDSKIFFTDEQRLTANSGAGSDEADLYECEIVKAPSGELECNLTDLTPETTSSGPAAVGGGVIGASENGSTVYFTAGGVLTGSEENQEHESAQLGNCREGLTCNLYVERDGVVSFIATLSGQDDFEMSTQYGELTGLAARVSPDGEWLAFMSDRSLTGYDNHDAVSGKPDQEVYLYHAGAGLLCASCNPTGARPHGIEKPRSGSLVGLESGAGPWAASLPVWHDEKGNYQTRYLSNSGRVFFDSIDSLVPQDINGTQDVYEYEPPAVGTCTASSTTFVPPSNGCVNLISSGASAQESVFLDASESGDDVFFLSTAALSSRDVDTSYDVYDARVGGGEIASTSSPVCEGDACQSPVQAPNDPTPDSLTFSGPGNLTPPAPASAPRAVKRTAAQLRAERLAKALRACRGLKSKKRRARCEGAAHKRYGPAKKASARQATNNRRTHS